MRKRFGPKKIDELRRVLRDFLHRRILGIQHAQRIGIETALRFFVEGIDVLLEIRDQFLPMRRALATASGEVNGAPLILIDLETEEGVTGIAYLFSPNPLAVKPLVELLHNMLSLIKGAKVAPLTVMPGPTKLCANWVAVTPSDSEVTRVRKTGGLG